MDRKIRPLTKCSGSGWYVIQFAYSAYTSDCGAESGDTMRAAGLHAIATVLETEAVLIKSSVQKHPHFEPLIRLITSRIAGVVAAGRYVVCEYNVRRDYLSDATAITPGRRAATISPLDDGEWVAVSAMVLKKEIADVMDRLVTIGAEDVLIFNLDNCRV
jgi:ATP phosphoribosyltransferase